MKSVFYRKALVRYAIPALCLAMYSNYAFATQYDLSFAGDPLNGSGTTSDYFIPLTSSQLPFTVSQGDLINASVLFSTPYTISPSTDFRTVTLYLQGSSFTSADTAVTSTFNFYLNGSLVQNFSNILSTTMGQLASGAVLPGPNSGFSFDMFTDNITVNTLSAPSAVETALFRVYTPSAVAVPGPIAGAGLPALLALLGVGGWWRRQKSSVNRATA